MLGDGAGVVECGALEPARVRRRRQARREDAVGVPILYKWISGKSTIAAAHRDHRHFAVERHPGFQDRRRAGERLPCGVEIGLAAQPELTLAVVAEPTRLEHGGVA